MMDVKTSASTFEGFNQRCSKGKSSFRATTGCDDKFLHVKQHAQTSDTAKLKKGSKIVEGGLRQYSIMVCKKVEDKGRITYGEVADEIIAEFMATDSNSSVPISESDEKNVRRRVYDSLNVLMALDVIERDRKEIHWKGLPNSDARDMEEIKMLHAELMAKIGKKAAYLQDLEEQLANLQNLKLRNEKLCKSTKGSSQGVSLPFVLVQTARHAKLNIEISEDNQLVHFDFESFIFTLHDDADVLKLMRHHGLLESKSVSPTS
ncbi:Transcription factor-like protein DPA [Capsicum baccatum]|uniref:Transcription factor-like protein DPA n=2 Tax=Capsicum TaxID=4071 RepID=A0A1U8EFG7_CAPAN|nr:transcription factor-like protein DPA isoform X1 [Capsicum annuum]KAF3664349.1 Transcription factor-like protein DPA [Capsicum annuum]PHT37672.1 Transcription factor-like protein DPA [Capsicum baccatum]PHT72150.1 Transcription factor-like protein DPA [Capsicum annuum]